MRRRWILHGFAIMVMATVGCARLALADEQATQDVHVTITDAGTFSVTLKGEGDDAPTFGTVGLDAITDQHLSQDFTLEYVDTQTQTSRGPGQVTLAIGSFDPEEPVPPFPGSDGVQFQIPNRYLVLTDVGDVVAAPNGPECAGAITAVTDDEGQSFDGDAARTVASIAEGCGVGSASQPINLALTIPAGVYPTTYSATVTITLMTEGT